MKHLFTMFSDKWLALRSKRFHFVLFFIAVNLFLFGVLYSSIRPDKVDLDIGATASETIRSPKTIEDKDATLKKKRDAIEGIKDQFTREVEFVHDRVELLSETFDTVARVKSATKKIQVSASVEGEGTPSASEDDEGNISKLKEVPITKEEQLELLRKMLSKDVSENLSKETFSTLLSASDQQINIAKEVVITSVFEIMNKEVRQEDVAAAKQEIADKIKFSSLPPSLRDAMTQIGRFSVVQNSFFDAKLTEQRKQEAGEGVEPVIIHTNDIIVKKGQYINHDIYHTLELVGLLQHSRNPFPYIGLMVLTVMMSTIALYDLRYVPSNVRSRTIYLYIYCIIFTFTIVLMKIISLFQQVGYYEIGFIMPIALATMLLKMLINDRIALISSIVFAICGSILFNGNVPGSFNFVVGVYLLISALSGIFFIDNQNHRSKILQSGLVVAVCNIFLVNAFIMFHPEQYTLVEILSYTGFAFISGFLSAVLTLGLMPFFEAGFGMVSAMKLIELSSPNHPLLRKILTETPGTYHHSVMVANLSEAACEAIGANGLLARVGAYYHDIGKTKRPHFFIENQMNLENPHDKISPQLSKTIIIAHPYDGADMLKKYKLPKEIIDIAEQHHGTTLLKFFYHKAKQIEPNLEEEDYRYPGPKAQSKEAAIVGIADSVEAAVRSLSTPTPQKLEMLVRNIISDRLSDRQLSECDLTLKELELVANSFCETLQGIFHSRIKYPEEITTKEKVKQA